MHINGLWYARSVAGFAAGNLIFTPGIKGLVNATLNINGAYIGNIDKQPNGGVVDIKTGLIQVDTINQEIYFIDPNPFVAGIWYNGRFAVNYYYED